MLALHTANKSDTDAKRVANLCDDFVVLSLYPEQMPAIRQYNPRARFHVRWWLDRGELPSVRTTVEAIVAWWQTWGQYVATFRAGNEPNLEHPGTLFWPWQLNLARSLHLRLPDIRYHLPAPSPGLSDFERNVSDMALVANHYPRLIAGLDAHAYGSPEEVSAVLATYRKYWDGELTVTEWNFGAGRAWDLNAYAMALPSYMNVGRLYNVQFMAAFIWEWDRPDTPLPTTLNIKDTPMEAAMRNYREELMPLKDQFPDLFAAWEAAGGVDNNFRSHLLAIGAITASKDDLRFLGDELQAKVNQFRNVANKLVPLA